jgi:preprotein translocase subunit YajC
MSNALPFIALFVPLLGIWLLFIRPARRRAEEAAQMVASLRVGQDIITTSGLYGTITGLDDESVLLAVAPGLDLRFDRRAVGQVRQEDLHAEDDPE